MDNKRLESPSFITNFITVDNLGCVCIIYNICQIIALCICVCVSIFCGAGERSGEIFMERGEC